MTRPAFLTRREFLATLVPLAGAVLVPGCGPSPRLVKGGTPTPPEAAPPPLAPSEPTILIAAAGDTTLGYNLQDYVDQQIAAGVPRERVVPLFFAAVKGVLEAADIAVVNLECPFTTRGELLKKNFNFRARPDLVDVLTSGSVDVVTLANNHVMDYGRDGLLDTMATLDGAGIARFGAGEDLAAARRPAVLERNGLRTGFLGYYVQSAEDMREPEAIFAKSHSAGAAGCYTDLACLRDQLREDVSALAPQVDAVIVFFHWGKEGSYDVRDYQIELAHLAVDQGCTLVLGAHPHRFQGVEVYRGAPIFYSLGNFVFGGIKEPSDPLSAIARVRLARKRVVEAELVPIQITRWPEAPFQPFTLVGEARLAALDRIAGLSRTFPETIPQLAEVARMPRPVEATVDSSASH